MNEENMNKTNEVRKCLTSAQRLGMDLAGLNLNLQGLEKQLVQAALSHVDHIVTSLNNILPKKEVEKEPREQPQKRAYGSLKL